jgi:Fe-S-cluster containining protein
MGEIIEIQEEQKPFFFRIRFTVTGEEQIVSIDLEKRELFGSQDITRAQPMACPFLREMVNKKFVCSVHGSRPDLCRQYSCDWIGCLTQKKEKQEE